jgi:uncharacterized protein (DUF952 family)
MAATDADYIYKIVPGSSSIPTTSSGQLPSDYTLPTSDLDKKSGFLHMSTAAQVPYTLKHFFATSRQNKDSIYLFKVPYKPLEDRGIVRWESPDAKIGGLRNGEGMFPHIYDDHEFKLGYDEVESVVEVVSENGEEDWEAALAGVNKWLV